MQSDRLFKLVEYLDNDHDNLSIEEVKNLKSDLEISAHQFKKCEFDLIEAKSLLEKFIKVNNYVNDGTEEKRLWWKARLFIGTTEKEDVE